MPDENKLATIEPETREETFLQDIADGTETLTPATRKEEFLRRIAAKPGLPSITESDEGKVLTVESGEAVWGESSSLPEITAQDEGKVLTVESGEAVWGEGGGGGGDLFEIVYSPASLTGVSSVRDGLIIVLTDAPAPVYEGPYYTWSVEGVAMSFEGETHNCLPYEKWQYVGSAIRLDDEEAGERIYLTLEVNDDGVFQLSIPMNIDGVTGSITGIHLAKSKDDRVDQIFQSAKLQRPNPNPTT